MSDILTTALELAAVGYSVIPIRADGTKAPAVAWKQYTQQPAGETQIREWFTGTDHDIAVIQGTVSGNSELTELEAAAATELPQLRQLAQDSGLGDLWTKISTGWVEQSPSGGWHFHTRLDPDHPVPGNTKLARTETHEVLAETRGEAGYVIVAPSKHHETGQPWRRIIGHPNNAPTLTVEEREAFHALLGTLDRTPPPPEPLPTATTQPRDPSEGITPGDDFENKTTWAEILTPHGWAHVFDRGDTTYWRRPGKNIGISATTGHAQDRDRLYVFTSSTVFAQETPYTKFGAYALLNYGGDHSAAAKQLAADGYGNRPEQPRQIAASDPFFEGLPNHTLPSPSPAEAENIEPPLEVAEPATYSETDDGNALRLIDTHHNHIRYVPQRGQWITWDGHKWAWDEAGRTREFARGIARNLPAEDKQSNAHRQRSLSRRGIEAMTALAQSDPRAVIHLKHLDARPYELNTPSGVVNLKTGELATPDPKALHTRSTTVSPDPTHPTPRWESFLADTFAGDPETVTYIQRLIGVSFVGVVLEQLLPFGFGPGANGKSVLFETIQDIAGIGADGYAATIPADMLVARSREDHPATIAQLAGVRIAIGGELEQGARFAEAKVKQLTGGDPINARFMGQNPFTFTPTHTLWLHANHEPEVRAGGEAFWRRIRQIPFLHTVPEEKRIKNLRELLVEEEGPGILAWIIEGASDYFKHGLTTPATVLAATATYQRETDTVAQFVEERCEVGSPNAQHMHVRTTTLRQAYESWCRDEGVEPVSARALTQQLRARYGINSSRSNTSRFYDGIRILDVTLGENEVSSSVTEVSRPGEEYGW